MQRGRILALDATRSGSLEHLAWVSEQLSSPRAQAASLRVAFGHIPIHPSAEGRATAILHAEIEEVFAAHDLSLYAAGHHHAYYPGASGGVRQVVMPCLGGGARALLGTRSASPRSLVMLQVREGEIQALEAFCGSELTTQVERSSLPERLGALERDDRAGYPSRWESPPSSP